MSKENLEDLLEVQRWYQHIEQYGIKHKRAGRKEAEVEKIKSRLEHPKLDQAERKKLQKRLTEMKADLETTKQDADTALEQAKNIFDDVSTLAAVAKLANQPAKPSFGQQALIGFVGLVITIVTGFFLFLLQSNVTEVGVLAKSVTAVTEKINGNNAELAKVEARLTNSHEALGHTAGANKCNAQRGYQA